MCNVRAHTCTHAQIYTHIWSVFVCGVAGVRAAVRARARGAGGAGDAGHLLRHPPAGHPPPCDAGCRAPTGHRGQPSQRDIQLCAGGDLLGEVPLPVRCRCVSSSHAWVSATPPLTDTKEWRSSADMLFLAGPACDSFFDTTDCFCLSDLFP